MEIYGNLIINSAYGGMTFSGSLADSLSARIYNNTFYHNYEIAWGHEFRVHTNSATITAFEFRNNIVVPDSSVPNLRCLMDDAGNITNHSNNIYYYPDGGNIIYAAGTWYSAATLNTWEPTALTGDPLLENPSGLPSGFTGAIGVDIKPNSDGLNITADSPARDAGAALDAAYNSSINSVARPQLAGWDIGAYEFLPNLALHGVPGDQMAYLDWTIDVTPPATATWSITYYSATLSSPVTYSGIVSHTRAYTLTGLTNYVPYTVTLSMVDVALPLSDTVMVIPTDRLLYLPTLLEEY
jgi:hypothetical protein